MVGKRSYIQIVKGRPIDCTLEQSLLNFSSIRDLKLRRDIKRLCYAGFRNLEMQCTKLHSDAQEYGNPSTMPTAYCSLSTIENCKLFFRRDF